MATTTLLAKSPLFQDAIDFARERNDLQARYDNFIGGKWVAPVAGRYYTNTSPINGKTLCESARSTPEDIELGLDAAHAAKRAWGEMSPTNRAKLLNQIADRIDAVYFGLIGVAALVRGRHPVKRTSGVKTPRANLWRRL